MTKKEYDLVKTFVQALVDESAARGMYNNRLFKIYKDIQVYIKSYNILRKFLKAVKNTDIYNLVNLIEACSTPSVFTVNA